MLPVHCSAHLQKERWIVLSISCIEEAHFDHLKCRRLFSFGLHKLHSRTPFYVLFWSEMFTITCWLNYCCWFFIPFLYSQSRSEEEVWGWSRAHTQDSASSGSFKLRLFYCFIFLSVLTTHTEDLVLQATLEKHSQHRKTVPLCAGIVRYQKPSKFISLDGHKNIKTPSSFCAS